MNTTDMDETGICEVCEEAPATETVALVLSGATAAVCERCAVDGADDGMCVRAEVK